MASIDWDDPWNAACNRVMSRYAKGGTSGITNVAIYFATMRLLPRKARSMPRVEKIAEFWGLPADTCWRCGFEGRKHIHRAHLIDRFLGGLDVIHNLALLCNHCNLASPIHEPGDDEAAFKYAGLWRRGFRP